MAQMSDYLENKLIDFIFRGGSFTPPSTLYIALLTAPASDSSTGSTITEVSGGNYARQPITPTSSNWLSTQGNTSATSNGTGGTTSNNAAINWTSVTWSATITSIAICDQLTGGNVLFYGDLSVSKVVSSGDSVSFSVNGLSVQIDN